MNVVFLRRRKLGKGSTNGIKDAMTTANVRVVRNWVPRDWAGSGGVCDPLLVFRWGCTSSLPPGPTTVVNTAESIHWCSDKRQGRLDMQAAGVPVPETWAHYNDVPQEAIDAGLVMRPMRHAQGRQLYVCRSYNDMHDSFHTMGNPTDGYYISRLVSKVAEYRVFVCQNRVVWVARKTPGNPQDVAWNVAQGGRFDNVKWSEWKLLVIQAALAAAKVSKTDFCGVDVMVDAEGNPYVLEVNSAPSQTSSYRKECVAKAFDYIVENGKEHFPDVNVNPRTTWKSFIHPAVRGTPDA